ncbi:hypothetical protein LTR95_008725 [Oleoguttula sp. CCFEE 5521]
MPRLRKKKTGAELNIELMERDLAARRERGEAEPTIYDESYFQNLRKVYDSRSPSRSSSTSSSRSGGGSSISRVPLPIDPQQRRKARIAEEMKAKNVENSRKANEKRQREMDDDWKERYEKAKAVAAEATARLEKAEAALREEYDEAVRGRSMFVVERDENGNEEVMEPLPKGAFGGLGVEMLPQRTFGDDDVEPMEMLPSTTLNDDFEEGEIREHELPPRPHSPLLPPTPKMASRATMPRLTRTTSTSDVNESKTIAQIAAEKQAKEPVREQEEVHEATDDPNILHYADVYERPLYGMFDAAQTPMLPPYPIPTRDTNQLNAACLEHDSSSLRSQDNANAERYPATIGLHTDISMIKDPELFYRAQGMKRQQQYEEVRERKKISAELEAMQRLGLIDPDKDVLAGTIVPGPKGSVSYFTKYGQYYGEELRSGYEVEKEAKETAEQEQFEAWLADQRIDIDQLSIDDIKKRCRSTDSLKTAYHASEAQQIPLSAYRSQHPALRPTATQVESDEDCLIDGEVDIYEGT